MKAKFKDDVYYLSDDVHGPFIQGSDLEICWKKDEILELDEDGLYYPIDDDTGFCKDDELIELI